MSYVDLADLVGYLSQFRDVDPSTPDLEVLEACLTRAEAFVNAAIGTTTNLAAAESAERVIYGNGLQVLPLPPHTDGSVELVETLSAYTVPDYIEQEGALVLTDSTGVVLSPWSYGLSYSRGSALVWLSGVPYTVTADFGWSASDLAVLAEATLQTAVQLWRYKDAGGSETIGNEGGILTVRAGWTPLVKQGLDDIARRFRGVSAGVW